jgi:hypothetical protein
VRPEPAAAATPALRLLESTLVQEPGQTGSLWRLHYSFQWPTLACDFFKLTAREGQGVQLGHLPKHQDDSAQAWLYGKVFVALLTEKLLAHARALSPWGYALPDPTTGAQFVAGI